MTQVAAHAARPLRLDGALFLRGTVFLAVFAFFWITVDPFHDLTGAAMLAPSNASDRLNQLAIFALTIACLALAAAHDWRRIATLFTPLLLALLLWIALSVVTSAEPSLSARRYLLQLMIVAVAAVFLTLPRDKAHFADLLAAGTLAVLAVCYGGLVLVPDQAMHTARELIEPEHAGNWRGLFPHKNSAGSAMAACVVVGLFVMRARSAVLGGAIVVLSSIFLIFSMAKTSIAILPVVLVVASVLMATPNLWLRLLIVGGMVGLLNLFTLGSVLFPPVLSLLTRVMPDPTFTNRDDIWRFAFSELWQRPLTGHGFQAFWGQSQIFYGGGETWAGRATDGHNAYLDLAVTAGIPAALLLFAWVVVQPVFDLQRAVRSGNDSSVTLLFVRLWLLGILTACLESSLFIGGGHGWFMTLVALFGLRLQATARLVADPVGAR